MLLRLKLHMKQFSPNEVTDEGIMINVKLLHSAYPLIVDYQYYILKTVEK